MGENSKIEWTDATWNPIRARLIADTPAPTKKDPLRVLPAGTWGYHCERISPGCSSCYACTMNGRTLPAWGTGLDYTVPNREKVEIYLDEQELIKPLGWKRPRKVFVCSMTDLFGEWVPDELIDRVFAVMALCPQHDFQVLTKRSKRMREWFGDATWEEGTEPEPFSRVGNQQMRLARAIASESRSKRNSIGTPAETMALMLRWPLPNVWLGVSLEDQPRADERISDLLATPAALRFLSAEPLLQSTNIRGHLMSGKYPADCECGHGHGFTRCPNYGGVGQACPARGCKCPGFQKKPGATTGIHWVIVGGESGPGARPCDIAWIRSIVEQCKRAGVACFVKQLGSDPLYPPEVILHPPRRRSMSLKDRKGGDMDEWPHDLRVREMPGVRP